MKTAKEVKINNRTYTELHCTSCGAATRVKAGLATKTTRQAMARRCGSCAPRNKLCGTGWWLSFGLPSNPYVYGPMPRMRTGLRYRMEEARRRGWMAWTWTDEYAAERRGIPVGTYKNPEKK